MDRETLEKLIENQPKKIRLQGALLFNAAATGAENYQKSPSAANRRNWEDAVSALKKFESRLAGATDPADKPLDTLAEVLAYLQESGWKITKPTLYRQHSKGKLAPRPDGTYAIKDVEKYARAWLKQKSTGKRIAEKIEGLQTRRLEAEISLKEKQDEREGLALEREKGLLIPRQQVENELATRAGILLAGLKHWIQSRAAEWIRLTGGDTKHVGDLINLMNHALDELINAYAAPLDYDVVIEAEETETEIMKEE